MAHYALLDENNVVTQVITGRDEDDHHGGVTDWESHYGDFHDQTCKRTSYNTHGNQHPNGTPFRGNYAEIGSTYDEDRDAFIPPQPYPSWVLDEETLLWVAPDPYPTDGNQYDWDEESQGWTLLSDTP